MGTYRVVGKPYAHPASTLVEGHDVGETFSADLSEEEEQGLVNGGVIEKVEEENGGSEPAPEQEPAGEPAGEPESEPGPWADGPESSQPQPEQ